MINEDVKAEILSRLKSAEIEHDVKVILAVESGSRAWGFESSNSDYDARFIYVNKPEWYLSVGLEEKRDVIEYPIIDDLDINGWDLRKALRLYWKSNPAFMEWVQSPLIYSEKTSFKPSVLTIAPNVYSVESGIYHYRSMAKNNFRDYLRADLVPLKKYFYVLRPLLSVRWLEKYNQPAPIEFSKLLHLINGQESLLKAIDNLLIQKRSGLELGESPRVPEIHKFIETELERIESVSPQHVERKNVEPNLSEVFRMVLREAWS
jgi:uncharacterized protein